MKVVFLTNYYNHHQSEFAENMEALTDGNFLFVETDKITPERLDMGWGGLSRPSYVKTMGVTDSEDAVCLKAIEEADAVLLGDAPWHLIQKRLKRNRLTFLYTERIYKEGFPRWKQPYYIIRDMLRINRHKQLYLLCASAYTAADFAKSGAFINKAYKWGYFPAFNKYDNIEKILQSKQKNSILWTGRLISWKHPEVMIELAEFLKAENMMFHISIIGKGELQTELEERIVKKNLQKEVEFLGSMSPAEVRSHMERSEILISTSDFNEGWGAVINEGMNSACTVIASHAVGAVPFLIDDRNNGILYQNGDKDDLFRKVKYILQNPEMGNAIGRRAYETIAQKWNAKSASERLVELIKELSGEKQQNWHPDGPCSKAEVLNNDWYQKSDSSL